MILLSGVPSFLLKIILAGKPVRRWIYLGKDIRLSEKLRGCLPAEAVQIDYARALNETSDEKRAAFVAWIDAVSGLRKDWEWFFSVPSVKNPNNSDLFLQVCYFFTIQKVLKKETPDLVIVDSHALAGILAANFPSLGTGSWVNPVAGALTVVERWGRTSARFVLNIAQLMKVFLAARSILKDRAVEVLKDLKDLVLIRNYATGNFSDSDQDTIEKRYFPGLYSFLEQKGKTPVFLPIAVQVKDYKTFFAKIALSRRRIVFIEEFLNWSDYLHLALTPFRAAFKRVEAPALEGFQLSALIAEEYYGNLTEHGFLLAVISSRFAQGLKRKGIEPSGIINWSEYQAFEKGLLAGLRKEFADVRIIAAHPFCIPPNHLCLIPSSQDKVLNILPNRSVVLGPLGKTAVSQYLSDLSMEYTPLFRYGTVYQPHAFDPNARDILALFGFSFANAVHSLRLLTGISVKSGRVLIKLHPLANFNKNDLIKAIGGTLPAGFEFIEGNLEDHLNTVVLGICGATGTAVELAVRGIPVIVIAETQMLTMNYLAYRQDPDIWRVCYTQDEFDQTLKYFFDLRTRQPERLQKAAQAYREAYFTHPDPRLFENLLINKF